MKIVLVAILLLSIFSCTKLDESDPAHVREWTFPASNQESISFSSSAVSTAPKMVMNRSGQTLIVWRQVQGAGSQLYMSEFRNGKWHDPESATDYINPTAAVGVFEYDVAISDNGDAVIVWIQISGGLRKVFKSELRDGTWTHPTSVTDTITPSSVVSNAESVKVSMSESLSIIAWQQNDTPKRILFTEYVDYTWSAAATISDSEATTDALTPGVSVGTKYSLIHWLQSDTTNVKLAKTVKEGDKWGTIESHGFPGADVTNPKMTQGRSGTIVALWNQNFGATFERMYRAYVSSSSWIFPDADDKYVNLSAQSTTDYAMAISDTGSAMAAYSYSYGGITNIYVSVFDGKTWYDPLSNQAISSGATNALDPSIAVDGVGNYTILWRQEDGGNNQLFIGQYKVNEGSFSVSNTPLSFSNTGVTFHAVAAGASQKIVLIWVQSDGTRNRIYRAEYR